MKDSIMRTLTVYSIIAILTAPTYGFILWWFYFMASTLGEGSDVGLFFVTGGVIVLYVYYALFPVILNLVWTAYKAKTEGQKKYHYLFWLIVVAVISAVSSLGYISIISVIVIYLANHKWVHKISHRVRVLLITLPFVGITIFTVYMMYTY